MIGTESQERRELTAYVHPLVVICMARRATVTSS